MSVLGAKGQCLETGVNEFLAIQTYGFFYGLVLT